MNRIVGGIFLAVAVALSCTALAAQDNPMPLKPKSVPQAMQMQTPTPAPEMTKLINMMAGNWTVTEKADPSPMFPRGGAGKGTAKLWAGPGGMSLLENYDSSGLIGTNFSGFGVFWWDSKAQAYHGLWCDSMTPGGCDSSGKMIWEGNSLVSRMEGEMNGQDAVTTFTYSDFKPDSFTMSMASGPDDSSLKPVMTVTYTKSR